MQNGKDAILAGLKQLQRQSFEVTFDLSGTDYVAQRNIGSGTYGIVCSAVNQRTGEPVAIKKVKNVLQNQTLAMRTYREIKILQHFQHDNIILIRDIFTTNGADLTDVYLVFDLMESDLHQVIRSSQQLTDEHVRYFLYQLLRGLKYIHSAHVIHRDLKPLNLLVNQDCELKIGDFGMARTVAFSNDDFMHQSQLMTQYVATRWYRAPELMLFRRQYTVDVDMWSVGCILAEMIARSTLFPGRDLLHQITSIIDVIGSPTDDFISLAHSDRVKDFLRKLQRKEPVMLKNHLPNAHPKALRLLEKMLRWNPSERITVEDALKDLYLNAYHSQDNEPACENAVSLKFDEEKSVNLDVLRDAICREVTRFKSEKIVKSSNSSVASSGSNVKPDVTPVSEHVDATLHVDASSKLAAKLLVNQRIRDRLLPASKSEDTGAPNSNVSSFDGTVSTQSTVLPAKSVRSSTSKTTRGRKRPAVQSKYRAIAPVAELTMADANAHEQPNAKAILRAAILSGRFKEPAIKVRSARNRKGGKNQAKQIKISKTELTEADKVILMRWTKMQETTAPCVHISSDVPSSVNKSLQSVLIWKLQPVSKQPVGTNSSVDNGAVIEDTVERSVNLPNSDVVDKTADLVRDSASTSKNFDRANEVEETETVSQSECLLPDSSDLRLISQCLASDSASVSWSPSVYLDSASLTSHLNDAMDIVTVASRPDIFSTTTEAPGCQSSQTHSYAMSNSVRLDESMYSPVEESYDAMLLNKLDGQNLQDDCTSFIRKENFVSCSNNSSKCSTAVPHTSTSILDSLPAVNIDSCAAVGMPESVYDGNAVLHGSAQFWSGSGYGVGGDLDVFLASTDVDLHSPSSCFPASSEVDFLIEQVLAEEK